MRPFVLAVLAAAAAAGSTAAAQPADIALGRRLWMQCRACHALGPHEPPRAGPGLHGVFGARAGASASFDYSPALKASGIVWTDETLDAFLANPAKAVKGNRMGFAGMPDAKDRAALIAFMKAQTR